MKTSRRQALYNKMMLDGLTLGEAFKIICEICGNRYPGSIHVVDNNDDDCNFVSVRFFVEVEKFHVFGVDSWENPLILDLNSKVKFEGEDLEVDGYSLTFFKQPETIKVMEHLLCHTSP